VVLNNRAVVIPEDPKAAQSDQWPERVIDHTRFADKGVRLTHVQSMTIGLGRRSNPQAGGKGLLYFDDVELSPEAAPPAEIRLEAEAASPLGAKWRTVNDPAASGGQGIGSQTGDGDDLDTAPGPQWVAAYPFTVPAGVYKIVLRVNAATVDDDSLWVRIVGAIHQTHQDPDQPGTGWVRCNEMTSGNGWVWDEIHSSDHNKAIVNWTLAAGPHTLEIAKREDGALIDALLITNVLTLDPATLP